MPTPIITIAPPDVDLAQFAEISNGDVLYPAGVAAGPWNINSAWYTCLRMFPDNNPNHTGNIAVYKWSGSAWVQKDGISTVFPSGWLPTYPGTGNTIYVLGNDTATPATNSAVQQFDCTTDTWQTRSALSGINVRTVISSQLIPVSTTEFWLWYCKVDAFPSYKVAYKKFSSGSWGLEVIVATITDPSIFRFFGYCIEASGRYHLVYRNHHTAGDWEFSYVQVSAAGVVATPASILTGDDSTFQIPNASFGYQPAIVGTDLYFPFSWRDVNADIYNAVVLRGAGLSAPAWTTEIVNDTTVTDLIHFWLIGGVMAQDPSGNPICFWGAYSQTGDSFPPAIQTYYATRTAGIWGAPILFFDSTVTPPLAPYNFGSNNQGSEAWYVTQNTDGTFSYGFAAVIGPFPDLDNNYYPVQFAAVEVGAQAPDITIDATLGAAFSFDTPSSLDSATHTICTINTATAGTLTDTPYIVRNYSFSHEPMPPDTVFMTQWSDLGYQFQKVARNLLLDIDTAGVAATVRLQGDGTTRQTFTVTTTSNDRDRVLSCNADLEGKFWRLTLTPGASAKTQLFKAGLDYVPDTNIITYLDTYEQDFGYVSWKYIKRGWVEYKGGPITLNFLVDGAVSFYSVTLPFHAVRDMTAFYLPAANGGVLNKSKTYRIQITGADGFRLYADSELEWYAFGSDQLGSFSMAQFSPEMKLPIAQAATGMWGV